MLSSNTRGRCKVDSKPPRSILWCLAFVTTGKVKQPCQPHNVLSTCLIRSPLRQKEELFWTLWCCMSAGKHTLCRHCRVFFFLQVQSQSLCSGSIVFSLSLFTRSQLLNKVPCKSKCNLWETIYFCSCTYGQFLKISDMTEKNFLCYFGM